MTSRAEATDGERLGWVAVAILLVTAAFLSCFQITDLDLGGHLTVGRQILKTGSIPDTDFFTHTIKGRPYPVHQWLGEVILFGVDHLTGVPGLILLRMMVVLGCAVLLMRNARREGSPLLLACGIATLLLVAARPRFFVRPFLVSAIFLPLLHAWTFDFRSGQSNRLWRILPLMTLWGHLHSGVVFGVLFLIAAISGEAVKLLLAGRSRSAPRIGSLTVLSSASFGQLVRYSAIAIALPFATVALVNPSGVKPLLLPFLFFKNQAFRDMIAEYKRVDLAVDWPFDLVAASVLLGVVLRPKRVDWTDVFVVGGFGTLAFAAVREILAFAVVSAPVLGRTWGSVFHDALGALAKRQSGPRNALAARWGLFAMILSASLFVNVKSARDWLFPFGFGKNPIHYPERALDFLEAQSVRGPIFNTDIWASSILWRWHGTNLPVFVDARLEAYPEDFWRDKYYRVLRAAPGWKHVLEEYDVQCAILRRTPGETDDRIGDVLWDDPEWGLVYWDDYAMIYLKKGNQRPRNAQVLATWAFTSFNPRRVQRIEELRGQTLVQAANELAELAEWSPESFLPWWALAVAWTRLGEGTRAVEIFARLGERKEATLNAPAFYRSRGEAELVAGHRDLWVSWMKRAGRNPDDPEALFEAASLASRAKGFSVAEELYREVLAKDPGHADAMNNLAVLLAREESGIPEALSLLEKAIAAHPGDPYYLASRGEVRWRAGDMARAGEDLQRAFEMLPKDDEAAREEVSRLIKRMD